MDLSTLAFPLTVDFGGSEYWIGETGPYKYGEAVTAFFIGENLPQTDSNRIALMQELEVYLKTFGNVLQPYPKGMETTDEMFDQLKQSSAECSVNYAYRKAKNGVRLLERYTFPSLRDFLYVELGKSIIRGNAPRKCRLCDNWFLHVHGERSIYCERIAPGETEQTCREVGARAVFEKKIQDEDAWKLYKRAYKKYYARYLKGRMEKGEFKIWAEDAAAERDTTIKRLELTPDEAARALIIGRLKEKLNDR